jgi:hypothetical protein
MVFTQIDSVMVQNILCPVMTWSKLMINYLNEFNKRIPNLSIPEIIQYDNKYTKSYSVKLNKNFVTTNTDLDVIESFNQISPKNQLLFFKDLIDNNITYETLHYFFSYMHVLSGSKYASPTYSLYAPLGTTSNVGIEFPPHFDLYKQKLLFIIYNDVSLENEAAITFLSKQNFIKIIEAENIKGKELILQALMNDLHEDQFDVIFGTLYKNENEFIKDLLFEFSSEVKIIKGDGFLCNDREWLHGRKAQSYKISNQRLIRYVFN